MMRIMFLNHSFKRHSPELEAHIRMLLAGYASPGTIFELAYPEDLGAGEVLSLLEERKALSGLHHILETPALVQKAIEAERMGFDAVIQSNTFDPGVEGGRLAVRIPVIGLLRTSLNVGATLCDRIGIIGPLSSDLPGAWRSICAYHMDHIVVGMRALEIYSAGLKARKAEIFEKTVALVRALVHDKGAQCIIP